MPNNNCTHCSPNHLACLMDQNTLALCEWSRGQIGWDDRLFPPETLPVSLITCRKSTGAVAFNRIVEPFVWQQNTFVLKYRPRDGALAVAAVDAAGAGAPAVWSGTWSAGWTAVKPFLLDGDVYLFGYNRTTGAASMGRLTLVLGSLAETWRGSWETGWSAVEPFAIGGDVHLVHNKVTGGTSAISRIEPGAAGVVPVWRGPGARGWTSVEPFALGA